MARIHLYRTYRWIDKDPVIDAVKTVVQDESLKNDQVRAISGVAAATLSNWFDGSTRKPQNATLTAVTSALGYVRRDTLNPDGTVAVGYVRARKLDWRDEIEKQADFILKNGTPKQKKAQKKKVNGNGHA